MQVGQQHRPAQRFWQPLGESDFGGIIAQLPNDVDAIYLGLGGTDAINFLNQYQQAGEKTRLIGGTIMADQTVLTARGRAKDALKGTPTSGPFASDNTDPAWTSYVKLYQDSSRPPSACPRRRCSGSATTSPRSPPSKASKRLAAISPTDRPNSRPL